MQEFFKDLEAIVGAENVFTDPATRLAVGAFPLASALPVLACVRPGRPDQVGKILRVCASAGQAVAFRGAGTAWNYAADAGPTLIILTDGLNRIYEVDAISQVIHLQPGVICHAAQEAAGREGMFLPGLPLSGRVATIGGAVACNAAGPDAARYGFLGSRVLSIDAWLTNGEKVSCFAARGLPGQMDDGLPLARLLAGSAGSLAFLGDMRLRLCPAPPIRDRILASGPWEQVVAVAPELAAMQPAQLYLLNSHAAQVLGPWPEALLHVEFHEPGQAERALQICAGLQIRDDDALFLEKRAGLMAAIYGQYGSFQRETCSFPPGLLPQFAAGAADIAESCGASFAIGIDGAIASAEIFVFPPQTHVDQELFALELMLNDALDSEEDAKSGRAQWRRRRRGVCADLCRQIQRLFDPAGILPPCAGIQ